MRLPLVLLFLALACVPRYRFDPMPKHSVEYIAPKTLYTMWWKQVEQCTGLKKSMSGVRFFVVVPSSDGFEYAGDTLLGLAIPTTGVIVFASNALLDADVVRHEFVHMIASPIGHDSTYFRGKCARYVLCTRDCQADNRKYQPDTSTQLTR